MKTATLYKKSVSYLETLCREIPERCVGSEGNRQAVRFFEKKISSAWFTENIDSQEITHTPKDDIDIVDCKKTVEIADALNMLIRELPGKQTG